MIVACMLMVSGIIYASHGSLATSAICATSCSFPKEPDAIHDHRWMAQLVAPPCVDRPVGEAATRALQLVSVASTGVNNLTKVANMTMRSRFGPMSKLWTYGLYIVKCQL